MMIEELNRGRVKGRKPHQCFDCYRAIPKGESHDFGTFKYYDVYTIRWHDDCKKASEFYRKFHGLRYRDFDDAIPPLADMISDFGEASTDYATLRGLFPHVVCRLELNNQLADFRAEKRWRADGWSEDQIRMALAS